MGGAIAVRGFELQHDLAGPGAAEPFVGQGRARDVATVSATTIPKRPFFLALFHSTVYPDPGRRKKPSPKLPVVLFECTST
jgi:hypothetical protein